MPLSIIFRPGRATRIQSCVGTIFFCVLFLTGGERDVVVAQQVEGPTAGRSLSAQRAQRLARTRQNHPSPSSSNLYWDTSGKIAKLQAGDGNWNTVGMPANLRWSTAPGGTSLVNWTNGRAAFFETSGTSLVSLGNASMTVDSMTFDGSGYTIGPSGGSLSLVGRGNITTNANASISAGLGGSVGLTKLGNSTLTLDGANVYTGRTTVSAGTLNLDNHDATTARLANTSLITIGSGGKLLLTQSGTVASTDRINNSAAVTLAGGTLSLNGVSEGTRAAAGIGPLSLTSSSKIDLAGTSLLHFAASNGQTWSGTLSIYDWSGGIAGHGPEQLLFGTNSKALTSTQLSQIQFYSDNGRTPYQSGAMILCSGEIVPNTAPVPEPNTWACVVLGLGVIACIQCRRCMSKVDSR